MHCTCTRNSDASRRHKTPSQPEMGGVHISMLGVHISVHAWSPSARGLPPSRASAAPRRPCRHLAAAPTRCSQLLQDVSRRRGVRGCHAHVCHAADSFHAQAQAAAPAARRIILRLAGTGPAGCCRRLRLAAVAASAEGVPIRRRNDCDQSRATTLRARTPRMPCHTYSQSHAVPQSCHAAAAPCVRGARTSL